MKYPDLDYFASVNFSNKEVDPYDLGKLNVSREYTLVKMTGSFTFEEAREWVDTLTSQQFDLIQTFFNTMPTFKHEIKVKNPKTKKENRLVIEGLADFFAYPLPRGA